MVYKIRNKGFNTPFAGNSSARILSMPKMEMNPDFGTHVTLQVQITRYNGMRILHNYRNISRATKQFMNGDKILEQAMIIALRDQFYRPNNFNAPIEQSYMIVSPFSFIYKSISLYRAVPSLISLTDTMVFSPTTNIQFSLNAIATTTSTWLNSTMLTRLAKTKLSHKTTNRELLLLSPT